MANSLTSVLGPKHTVNTYIDKRDGAYNINVFSRMNPLNPHPLGSIDINMLQFFLIIKYLSV